MLILRSFCSSEPTTPSFPVPTASLQGVPEPEDPWALPSSHQVLLGSSAPSSMLPPLLHSNSSAAVQLPPANQSPCPSLTSHQLPFPSRYAMPPIGASNISDGTLMYPQLYGMSQEFNLLGVPATGRSPAGSRGSSNRLRKQHQCHQRPLQHGPIRVPGCLFSSAEASSSSSSSSCPSLRHLRSLGASQACFKQPRL